MLAPDTPPPTRMSSSTTPPMAIAAAGADRARVGGDGHDHEHQQRAEDGLDDQRGARPTTPIALAPRLPGLSGQIGEQQQAGERGAGELRADVGRAPRGAGSAASA